MTDRSAYDDIGELELTETTTISAPYVMGGRKLEVVEPYLTLPPGRYRQLMSPAAVGGPVRLVRDGSSVFIEPAG